MKNPATQSRDDLNAFTSAIKARNGMAKVRLRNGQIVFPTIFVAEEEPYPESFHVVDDEVYHPGYRWNLDGTGIKNYIFDMMEIVA
jgi:hypothetical protein